MQGFTCELERHGATREEWGIDGLMIRSLVTGSAANRVSEMIGASASPPARRGLVARMGTDTKMYSARIERDGRFWLIHVAELDRYTQARNLRTVENMARDLVAAMLEVAHDSFELDVQLHLPLAVSAHLEAAARLRAESAAANTAAAAETRAAARELAALGLPIRDIGAALGVSHQRAHQLVR